MIDWVKAVIPWRHSELLHGGKVISILPSGDIEWTAQRRLVVRGSYESSLNIISNVHDRDSVSGDYLSIVFDGNPVKFHQGHNLFGTNDLIGLVLETCLKVSGFLNLPISNNDLNLIECGRFYLKRIDSTIMIDLGNQANVESFLYSAERLAHMRRKGQGLMQKGTLYFGKHSRRESLKFYSKAKEIRVKGHRLPLGLEAMPRLMSWVDSKLRVEHTLRSLELKDRGLHLAASWNEGTPNDLLMNSLSMIDMSENYTIAPTLLENLPPRLVAVYHLWLEGHDLRAMFPKMTFYRYRKQLQEAAKIDIAIKQGSRQEPAPNVIDFRRVLVPEIVEQVPPWAKGTSLYFEPKVKNEYFKYL